MLHNKYSSIMKHFLKGYNKEIYGRELIKKVNISQKNIALTLEELEKEGTLSSKTRGNTRYYSLNKLNPLCKRYILLAEVENSIKFLKNNPKISQILNKINKNQIICIFGSYAKETQKKDSDLDLFIVGKFDEKSIKELGKNYNLELSIKKGSKLDFIKLLKDNNPLMNEILENHIIISGYEEFIDEVTKQKW
ncbi:nucleotidyltransferase domain-containing protein [archaeon]|nr:nucleotidyltransferase domain-containing protein [archaeon]